MRQDLHAELYALKDIKQILTKMKIHPNKNLEILIDNRINKIEEELKLPSKSKKRRLRKRKLLLHIKK